MVITSKNGFKLDVSPKNKWNPLDWIVFIFTVFQIKNQNIYMNKKDWKIRYGRME